MIWVSSDLHFLHDKEFIYQARGFDSIEQMNRTIIDNFNKVVNQDDELYILGDLALGGAEGLAAAHSLVAQLPGKLHIVRGNHETAKRIEAYSQLPNVHEIQNAIYLDYHKFHFYLSHYPTITTNYDDDKKPWQRTLCLSGHTHSKDVFEECGSYNVSVDAHNCYPVSIDTIISDFRNYFTSPILREKPIYKDSYCSKCLNTNFCPGATLTSDNTYDCPTPYFYDKDPYYWM